MSLHVTRSVLALAALVAAPVLFSEQSFAKTALKKDFEIVAHLPGQAAQATQLTVRTKGSHTYLYVYEPAGDALTTFDVTKPEKPVVLGRTVNAGGMETERIGSIAVVKVSDRLAIGATGEAKSRFLDLSDPEHPRPIPQLDGATGMAADKMRGYLFIANDKGLWVIHDDSLMDPGARAWWDFANAP